jgi:hypothetical protein
MNNNVDSFVVTDWFESVKNIYKTSEGYKRHAEADQEFHGRLIPLCTPVLYKPRALVIGTNHSVFVDRGGTRSEELAKNYANGNPDNRHTLVDDHHKFARNLKKLISRGGQSVCRDWVCTNRCAIQTGTAGINAFKSKNWHCDVQSYMDELLLQLIGHLEPQNLILCGNYAAELIFGSGAQISQLLPEKRNVSFSHQSTGVDSEILVNTIPVWHPSRVRYDPYANYVREHWEA